MSGEMSKKKQHTTVVEKHAYVQGVGWATAEVDRRQKYWLKHNIAECEKDIKRKSTRILAR